MATSERSPSPITKEDLNRFGIIDVPHTPLYPSKDATSTIHSILMAQEAGGNVDVSNQFAMKLTEGRIEKDDGTFLPSVQGVIIGRKIHPFDFTQVVQFKTANVHHSTCINTKKAATVGLGFADDAGNPNQKVSDILNPISDQKSFQNVIDPICEDYWNVGTGYMEVTRDKPGGKIMGLHHLAAQDTYLFLENAKYDYHFEVISHEGSMMRRFSKFGDSVSFAERLKMPGLSVIEIGLFGLPQDVAGVSEVIEFRLPSSMSRWYGFCDWLAAIAKIELVQCKDQFEFDFFNNRGVPEFALFLLGAKMDPEEFKKITDTLLQGAGKGKSHKSIVCNIANQAIKVQLEKMAMEGSRSGQDSGSTGDTNALDIVSAHRVPPILAGIQIPGKLGASNEIPNAIMAFQSLVIAQAQNSFKHILGMTLGDTGSGLGLKMEDFNFRKITDEINAATAAMAASAQRDSSESAAWGAGADNGAGPSKGPLDTMSRMRQSIPAAAASGRNLNGGLKG